MGPERHKTLKRLVRNHKNRNFYRKSDVFPYLCHKFENIAFAIVLRVKKIANISDSLKSNGRCPRITVGIFLVGCSGVWRYLLTDKEMPTFLRLGF